MICGAHRTRSCHEFLSISPIQIPALRSSKMKPGQIFSQVRALDTRLQRLLHSERRRFLINKRRLNNFISAGAIDADSPAICLIGMPKADCLVDGSLQRENILQSLGIDPSRRTVLYAPTWTPFASLNAMGEELVAQLGRAGFCVIVKLHDN